MMRNRAVLIFSAAIIACAVGAIAPNALSQKRMRVGATFTVNTVADTVDVNPGDGACSDATGACSLRAAISEANALPGADTITMSMGTYGQTLVAPNDDSNAGGDWDITSVITINGTGEANCILEAAGSPGMASERVLDVRPGGVLTLSLVTARNGNFSGAITANSWGAGIENLGELNLERVTVRDNSIASNSGDPYGGGIYNAGTAMILRSVAITANTVSLEGEGNAFGGGIASTSQSTLSISNCFIGNTGFANAGSVSGAGLYLENRFTLNMTETAIAGNVASGMRGTNGSGVSAVANGGAAVLNTSACVFRNNSSASSSGGEGVGLYFLTTGSSANTLTANLDGASVNDNIGNSIGAGICATLNGGDLIINILNSSITNNLGGAAGGGIWLTDAGPPPAGLATINLTNTTISNNVANGGGGLLSQGKLTSVNLDHVTVAGNTADSCGGICTVAGIVNIRNSIIGDNFGGTNPDVGGVIVSGDYNHFETTAGATIFGTTTHNTTGDALLGPLVQYVGGTVNMTSAASPVVNSIPSGINGCGTTIITDQRGARRPQADACDKGAVERVAFASISGRVLSSHGRGIRTAFVILSVGIFPSL